MAQVSKVIVSLAKRNKEICDKIADALTIEGVMHAEIVGSRSVTFVTLDQPGTVTKRHINDRLDELGVSVLAVAQSGDGVIHILSKVGRTNGLGVDLSVQGDKAKGLF